MTTQPVPPPSPPSVPKVQKPAITVYIGRTAYEVEIIDGSKDLSKATPEELEALAKAIYAHVIPIFAEHAKDKKPKRIEEVTIHQKETAFGTVKYEHGNLLLYPQIAKIETVYGETVRKQFVKDMPQAMLTTLQAEETDYRTRSTQLQAVLTRTHKTKSEDLTSDERQGLDVTTPAFKTTVQATADELFDLIRVKSAVPHTATPSPTPTPSTTTTSPVPIVQPRPRFQLVNSGSGRENAQELDDEVEELRDQVENPDAVEQ